MSYARNSTLIPNARSLRKNMTKEERHLWYDFLRYCKPRFRRQEIVSSYILDFFCSEAKLAIELDGSQHFEPKAMEYDARRSCHLQNLGITLIRFPNSDINNNFQGVCQYILHYLEEHGFHPAVNFEDGPARGNRHQASP